MPTLKKMFGAQVRHYRTKVNLTQTQLADKIEVTPEMIGKIERGVSGASFNTIEKLCDALGISANELFPPVPVTIGQSSHLSKLTLRIMNMSEAQAKWVYDLLAIALDKPDFKSR